MITPMPRWNGNGKQKLSNFLIEFEGFCLMSGIVDEKEQIHYLHSALDEGPKMLVARMLLENPEEVYRNVKTALSDIYGQPISEDEALREIGRLRRTPGQSIAEFAEHLSVVAGSCAPAIPANVVMEKLLEEVPPAVRTYIKHKNPGSLNETLKIINKTARLNEESKTIQEQHIAPVTVTSPKGNSSMEGKLAELLSKVTELEIQLEKAQCSPTGHSQMHSGNARSKNGVSQEAREEMRCQDAIKALSKNFADLKVMILKNREVERLDQYYPRSYSPPAPPRYVSNSPDRNYRPRDYSRERTPPRRNYKENWQRESRSRDWQWTNQRTPRYFNNSNRRGVNNGSRFSRESPPQRPYEDYTTRSDLSDSEEEESIPEWNESRALEYGPKYSKNGLGSSVTTEQN